MLLPILPSMNFSCSSLDHRPVVLLPYSELCPLPQSPFIWSYMGERFSLRLSYLLLVLLSSKLFIKGQLPVAALPSLEDFPISWCILDLGVVHKELEFNVVSFLGYPVIPFSKGICSVKLPCLAVLSFAPCILVKSADLEYYLPNSAECHY